MKSYVWILLGCLFVCSSVSTFAFGPDGNKNSNCTQNVVNNDEVCENDAWNCCYYYRPCSCLVADCCVESNVKYCWVPVVRKIGCFRTRYCWTLVPVCDFKDDFNNSENEEKLKKAKDGEKSIPINPGSLTGVEAPKN